MNTAIIGHILNQRLRKGQIWPSWWEGNVWSPRKWLPFLALLGIFYIVTLPLPWIFEAPTATPLVGRSLFLFSFGVMCLDALTVFETAYRDLRRYVARGRFELITLAHQSARAAVLEWFIVDALTLHLRMMRYIPLFAISVVAIALPWADCARIVAATFAAATAVLALLYAATIAVPNATAVPTAVGLVAVLWFIITIVPSSFSRTGFRSDFPALMTQLAAITVFGVVAGMAALTVRVRYGTRHRRPRTWRLPVFFALRRIPEAALLVRGAQQSLGMFGGTAVWLSLFFVCLGVAWIPWAGWIIALGVASAMVAPFMRALWTCPAWPDVCLASASRESVRGTVCTAVLVATSPVLPALLIALPLGRGTILPYSLVELGHNLTDTMSPARAATLVVALAVLEIAVALLAYVACVLASLETWVDKTTRVTRFMSKSGKELRLVVLITIAFAAVSLVTAEPDAQSHVIAYVAALAAIACVAGLYAFRAWRNLNENLQRLIGTTADDFAPLQAPPLRLNMPLH